MARKVAIIGAGLAGLSCAHALRGKGVTVDIFEEAPTIGGRVATTCIGADRFDHGAQYFSPNSADFRSYLEIALESGYAARWTPRIVERGGRRGVPNGAWFVGRPGMSSIVRPLAHSSRIAVGRRARSLERRENGWHVWFEDDTSAGSFDAVAIAVPAPKALDLVSSIPAFQSALRDVRMLPCWALMVCTEGKGLPAQDVFTEVSEVIPWIARNNTKPGRNTEAETLVVHASPSWSLSAENADPEDVAAELWSDVCDALNLPPIRPLHMMSYFWRHGVVERPLGQSHLFCPDLKIGLAGDWCLGASGEHAFTSGGELGRAISSALGSGGL